MHALARLALGEALSKKHTEKVHYSPRSYVEKCSSCHHALECFKLCPKTCSFDP
jgi:hypothetical protein